MSGNSWAGKHKRELEIAAAIAAGGAGLGAAGIGPMAGLFEGAAAATPAAGAALPGASGMTDLIGATGAPLASTPSVANTSFLGGLLGSGGSMDKASKAYAMAQLSGAFNQPPMPQAQPAPPPRTPQAQAPDISQELAALYGRRKWLDDLLNPENPLGGPRYG